MPQSWSGWSLATVLIALALAGSTFTHLHQAFRFRSSPHQGGMSPSYMWLRSILFVAMTVVLGCDPEGTTQTRILAVLSGWYVIFYGILLKLHYQRRITSGTKESR